MSIETPSTHSDLQDIKITTPGTTTGSGNPELIATAPGQIRVIRRNGSVTPYDDSKIAVAMTKAFLAVACERLSSILTTVTSLGGSRHDSI